SRLAHGRSALRLILLKKLAVAIVSRARRPALSGVQRGGVARSGRGQRRRGDQFRHLAEVLRGRGQEELVASTARTAQSQAIEAQDALQVGEQHLDFLPLSP